jgi:hypothetical protein
MFSCMILPVRAVTSSYLRHLGCLKFVFADIMISWMSLQFQRGFHLSNVLLINIISRSTWAIWTNLRPKSYPKFVPHLWTWLLLSSVCFLLLFPFPFYISVLLACLSVCSPLFPILLPLFSAYQYHFTLVLKLFQMNIKIVECTPGFRVQLELRGKISKHYTSWCLYASFIQW